MAHGCFTPGLGCWEKPGGAPATVLGAVVAALLLVLSLLLPPLLLPFVSLKLSHFSSVLSWFLQSFWRHGRTSTTTPPAT